jgi:hypothetical protein
MVFDFNFQLPLDENGSLSGPVNTKLHIELTENEQLKVLEISEKAHDAWRPVFLEFVKEQLSNASFKEMLFAGWKLLKLVIQKQLSRRKQMSDAWDEMDQDKDRDRDQHFSYQD